MCRKLCSRYSAVLSGVTLPDMSLVSDPVSYLEDLTANSAFLKLGCLIIVLKKATQFRNVCTCKYPGVLPF